MEEDHNDADDKVDNSVGANVDQKTNKKIHNDDDNDRVANTAVTSASSSPSPCFTFLVTEITCTFGGGSSGASVTVMVEEITTDKKVVVFRKKRKKNFKRKNGHKRAVTFLRVLDIQPPTKYQGSDSVIKSRARV